MSDYPHIKPEEVEYIARSGECKLGAINIVHIPTGIIVKVDSARSQHRNRHLAMFELNRMLEERAAVGCDSEEYF
jgi:protein subunit release factor A